MKAYPIKVGPQLCILENVVRIGNKKAYPNQIQAEIRDPCALVTCPGP